jgi:hypothetical protein
MFETIADGIQEITTPLGGVHKAVIEQSPHTKEFIRDWGLLSINKRKFWKKELASTDILETIPSRLQERSLKFESIVSRKIDAAWLSGSQSMDRQALVEVLEACGYSQISDKITSFYRVETFCRTS